MARRCRTPTLLRLLALAWLGGVALFVLCGYQPGVGIEGETQPQVKPPRPAARMADAGADLLDEAHDRDPVLKKLKLKHTDRIGETTAEWKARQRASQGRLEVAGGKPADVAPAMGRANPVVAFELQIGPGDVGTVVLEVHTDWAPLGARRFLELVDAGFFTGVRFFRVVAGFMAQFGIAGDPQQARKWGPFSDEPVVGSNTPYMLSFAASGPDTRTTQMFINFPRSEYYMNKAGWRYKDLDQQGFAPFAEVIDGRDVVDRINSKHGEEPNQGLINAKGNAYLAEAFPALTFIRHARRLDAPTDPGPTDPGPAEPSGFLSITGVKTVYKTLTVGAGSAVVTKGDTVTVQAAGVVQESAKQFWSTKDPGQKPFTYRAGVGGVIKGWDQGCLGMARGEVRLLIIPAAEGYGDRGFPSWGIPAQATLEFQIEVLKIA